ncbi:hypothetical protein PLICRDRAFT_40373 [Plicaturopsis crispa FD-325 SS-3]|nr:hypothetical protein PLICRDRAFT_40373 [Plicaturopsis crispa FD-325 SS-3]
MSPTPYLSKLAEFLPEEMLGTARSSNHTKEALDELLCFALGGPCPTTASQNTRAEWERNQPAARQALDDLVQPSAIKRKRTPDADQPPEPKKPKLAGPDPGDTPHFTLNAVSTTSPIRKKVDITIHASSIQFTHPTTHAVEASVPLSVLKRAFILPTRGKGKAHWTIVLLSADTPDASKGANAPNPQVIFGLDALATSAFTTTDHSADGGSTNVAKKGSETLPALRAWLSHLRIPVLEPSTDVFRSACARDVPGVEAYRGAKPGSLWFLREGILADFGKPCEFWALEDLVGKNEGVRLVSATGRTCSVIVRRKDGSLEEEGEGDATGEEEGIETEFGMVEGKEQEPIRAWARAHRHLFGKKIAPIANGNAGGSASTSGKVPLDEDSDPEDDDFEMDSDDSDGGSVTSSSSDGSGAVTGSDDYGADEAQDDAEESSEEGEPDDSAAEEAAFRAKADRHPLMRPGAMPKHISRAAIDMVVGMVESDMMGGGEGEEDELDDEDEDELDE